MEKEMLIEIIAHIMTVEQILMEKYNISDKTMNENNKANKEYIREQLK